MEFTKKYIFKVILYCFCCGFIVPLQAQYLHTPSEINQLIDNSSLTFTTDSIANLTITRKTPILEHSWYAIQTSKGVKLDQPLILTNKKALKYQSKANKSLKKKQYEKARRYFTLGLKESETSTKLMNGLAKTYIASGNYKMAEQIVQDIIAINPIDFHARELLADIFFKEKNEAAVKEISLAHLLNRNDPALIDKLQTIYAVNGLSYQVWQLNPQCEIKSTKKNVIAISYRGAPWLAYANCKAIWLYEEGYKEKMEHLSSSHIDIIEEKECLLSALLDYQDREDEAGNYPALEMLGKALEKRVVDNYILYEKIAVEEPSIVSRLSMEQLEALVVYLTTIRSKVLLEQ